MKQLTEQEQSVFWNAKAKNFPRYEDKSDNYESGMLRRIENLGVDFHGRSILDVGCGSGMYTIRLAKMALSVTALDVSEEMLSILNHDAKTQGVDNIRTVLSGWDSFTPEKHDIAFCSMTPAIHSDSARAKLTASAKECAVYMGFDGVKDSDLLNHLHPLFGVKQKEFKDASLMRDWLSANSISYREDVVEGTWVKIRDEESTVDDAEAMLSTFRIEPDREIIRRAIQKFSNGDGTFTENITYRIGIIVWSE